MIYDVGGGSGGEPGATFFLYLPKSLGKQAYTAKLYSSGGPSRLVLARTSLPGQAVDGLLDDHQEALDVAHFS